MESQGVGHDLAIEQRQWKNKPSRNFQGPGLFEATVLEENWSNPDLRTPTPLSVRLGMAGASHTWAPGPSLSIGPFLLPVRLTGHKLGGWGARLAFQCCKEIHAESLQSSVM